jgi:hypothetical protein
MLKWNELKKIENQFITSIGLKEIWIAKQTTRE